MRKLSKKVGADPIVARVGDVKAHATYDMGCALFFVRYHNRPESFKALSISSRQKYFFEIK